MQGHNDKQNPAEHHLRVEQEFLQPSLDALPAHIAVIDARGTILAVNAAWRRFADSNGMTMQGHAVGSNYLRISDMASGNWATEAEEAAQGIRDLLAGRRNEFYLEYPCHSPTEKRWFMMRATRFHSGGSVRVVVMHENITERKLAEEALQESHDYLEERVRERTDELVRTNEHLKQEIRQRQRAEAALHEAISEIQGLKDQLEAECLYLQDEIKLEHNFDEIIGKSKGLKDVLLRVEQIAPTDTTVLILGETGTGKELIARAIHHASPRGDRPLVKVDCAALPANLVESELFGREKGAYTDAQTRQLGRYELASGSSIFLDEIGDLPLELQAKLLRVLQDGEFERLGSPHTIKVDVRVIAATNRDLEYAVQRGQFRKDLWYRLNVFPIRVPPLRKRLEDIPLLVNWFVTKLGKRLGKKIERVERRAMDSLKRYPWPGNVRELENVIERALITSQGPTLHLMDTLDGTATGEKIQGKTLAEIEREHIIQVLENCSWRIEGENGAAKLLGLNPSTLRARLRKHGIRRPSEKSTSRHI